MLSEDLAVAAEAAAAFAGPGERLTAVIPAEPGEGRRVYLCAFEAGEGTSWLALDGAGRPVENRGVLREAVSIAAMCELAEEIAAGGDLDELRARLVALRLTEDPPGIEEAEAAAETLQRTVGGLPRLATPAYLDAVGAATLRLERALGEIGRSPFAEAMKLAPAAVDDLTRDVEASYKAGLL